MPSAGWPLHAVVYGPVPMIGEPIAEEAAYVQVAPAQYRNSTWLTPALPTPSSAVALIVCPFLILAAAAGAVNVVAAPAVSFLIVNVVVAVLPAPSAPVSVCVLPAH